MKISLMKTKLNQVATTSLSFCLALVLSQNTLAEDVEIYQGQAVGVRQNIVFAMDTSRSMSYWEEQDIGPFDPKKVYPKPINGFDPDGYYYSLLLNGNGTTDSEIALIKQRYFNPSALKCKGAKSILDNHGVMHGKFKRWDPIQKDWETPLSNLDRGLDLGTLRSDAYIECKADEGRHPVDKYIDTRGSRSDAMYTSRPKWNYASSWLTSINHLYTGNYLNYQIFAGDILNQKSKMSRMVMARSAVTEVVNTISGVRMGLMRFSSNNQGGFVDVPVDDIENVRKQFVDKVNSYFTWGGTPLSETYHEAALYLRGDTMRYGGYSQSVEPQQDVFIDRDQTTGLVRFWSNYYNMNTVETPSVPLSRTSNSSDQYLSPITNSCQSNNSIILFTDGLPWGDESSNNAIKAMIKDVDFPSGSGLSKNCSGEGGCADELAYYLANYDQNPNLPGIQLIKTYVVGGFIDSTDSSNEAGIKLMKSIAYHGQGKYFPANNHAEIVAAINKAIGEVKDTPATFVAPAISANSYNSLEHLDDLYYAMFAPSGNSQWSGNLKAYRLSGDGTIVDAEGNPAINTDGAFKKESRSYWTEDGILDGAKVDLGGAASRLTGQHKIFTHLSGSKNQALTDTLNINTISKSLLGVADNTSTEEHQALIDWGNRISSATADGMRRKMEDPLHSRPVVINYSTKRDKDGKIKNDSAVFVATNSGYLHAFKADKKVYQEYFSFVPKELLKNFALYKNGAKEEKKVYGLDGAISYWHQDKNRNRNVDTGEKVFLYVGMRRGGRNYYALDVTDREKPKYAWQINGGSGKFANLGQTWSEMTLAKVPWQGGHKVVLFFGGGYDKAEDDRTTSGTHNIGNSIYMVDAETGQLLWQTSDSAADFNHSEMTRSIVSDIRPVDVNGDTIMDYFYLADVGGKVWRFDINGETKSASDFAEGGVIFDANGDAGSGYQRFFNSPSVAYFVRHGERFLTISLGSGFRAHPLQDTEVDSFYILKDYDLQKKPLKYVRSTPSMLAEIGDPHASDDAIALGWKYQLPGNAEKVLANALTSNDTIYFTAFAPSIEATEPGSCIAGVGTAKAYSIKISDNPKDEPEVIQEALDITIPPAQPIAILTSTSGDSAYCAENPNSKVCFCELNPGHEDCKEKDDCESSGSVILSGTEAIGGKVTRCELLKKTYWLEN